MNMIYVSGVICAALCFSATSLPTLADGFADVGGTAIQVAQTDGQERRDERSDDRNDRQDDRQDCRTAEGAGADKRDCKQDAREGNEASTDS